MAHQMQAGLGPQRTQLDEEPPPVPRLQGLAQGRRRLQPGAVLVEEGQGIAQRAAPAVLLSRLQALLVQRIQTGLERGPAQPDQAVEGVMPVLARGDGGLAGDEALIALPLVQGRLRHEAQDLTPHLRPRLGGLLIHQGIERLRHRLPGLQALLQGQACGAVLGQPGRVPVRARPGRCGLAQGRLLRPAARPAPRRRAEA